MGERGSHGSRGLPRPETPPVPCPTPSVDRGLQTGPGLALARLLPASTPLGADPPEVGGDPEPCALADHALGPVFRAQVPESRPFLPGPSSNASVSSTGWRAWRWDQGTGGQAWGLANPSPPGSARSFRSGGPWTPSWPTLVSPRAGGPLPELSWCVHTGSGPPASAPRGSQRGPDSTSVAIAAVGSKAGAVFPGFRSFPDLTVGLCLK